MNLESYNTGQCHVVVRGRHGHFIVNKNDLYLGQSIIQYGEYSPEEFRLLEIFARPGSTVVDVGANYGLLTIPLAFAVGDTGRVIAFEPQSIAFNALCGSLALNELTNVSVHKQAVGGSVGRTFINRTTRSQLQNANAQNEVWNTGSATTLEEGSALQEEVDRVTIDSLALDRVTLLKIDVEGMELPVIEGSVETLKRCRPLVYAENDRAEHSSELLRLLEGLGYKCFWHQPMLFEAGNFRGNQTNLYEGIASCNILCIPNELDFTVPGLTYADPEQPHPWA